MNILCWVSGRLCIKHFLSYQSLSYQVPCRQRLASVCFLLSVEIYPIALNQNLLYWIIRDMQKEARYLCHLHLLSVTPCISDRTFHIMGVRFLLLFFFFFCQILSIRHETPQFTFTVSFEKLGCLYVPLIFVVTESGHQ